MPSRSLTELLFDAIDRQDLSAVDGCLANGADLCARNHYQHSPLYAAMGAGERTPDAQAVSRAIVRRLAQAHPTGIDERMNNGQRPMDRALDTHRWHLVRWLLDEGCSWTASPQIIVAVGPMAQDGATDLLARLVPDLAGHNLSVRIAALDDTIARLRHPAFAAHRTTIDTTARAWRPVWDAWDRSGLPLGQTHPELHGVTSALACLARRGRTADIRVLLAHGVDPNHGGESEPGQPAVLTPLHLAALGGHRDACVALLDGGADAFRPAGRNDETPLAIAHRFDRTTVVVLLEGLELRRSMTTAPAQGRERPRL